MAKFVYNNAKNASTGHIYFKLNCSYHFWILYKNKITFYFKSKSANKLLAKLRELIIIYRENFHHTHKFQIQAYDKGIKFKNYPSSKKVWLYSKYIKIKLNLKLEIKFFRTFQVLHSVSKQVYKLKLPKK